MATPRTPEITKQKLVTAAQLLFVERGYNATSVDEICSAAGTTKGAFFHHFESKDELGLLALERFAFRRLSEMQAGAPGWPSDPLERLLSYVREVAHASATRAHPRGCLIAIMATELGVADERFRGRCDLYLRIWSDFVLELVEAAVRDRGAQPSVSSRQIADYFIAVFEGSVIQARATGDMSIFERNLLQYETYLRLLLARPVKKRVRSAGIIQKRSVPRRHARKL